MNIEQAAAPSHESTSSERPRIFIVHGHHEELLAEVSECLRRLGAEPVVLRDQAAGGRTIIENLERQASQVVYAVVLMTGDDWGRVGIRRIKGKSFKHLASPAPRARQNVVFEAGLFVGKLGRANVCFLHAPRLEQPSDLHGVIYINLGDGWQNRLAQEVLTSGVLGSRTS